MRSIMVFGLAALLVVSCAREQGPLPPSVDSGHDTADEAVDAGGGDDAIDRCGNGAIDSGESCDVGIAAGQPGACPTECSDGQACSADELLAADTCSASCTFTPITVCGGADGCCPAGCSSLSDGDCSPTCGDGVLDPGESCDTGIVAGSPGACPTACDDGLACTADQLLAAGSCSCSCSFAPITTCGAAEGCCPTGCSQVTDSDCLASCGNGVLEVGEACDVAIPASDPGACPTACDDLDACTEDTLVAPATCSASCSAASITQCGPTETCCPAGCTSWTDVDCECTPGPGAPLAPSVVEPGPGPADLPPAKIYVSAYPFVDPDGDAHAESKFEIWLAPGGVPATRVWSALLVAATRAAISQGTFDPPYTTLLDETSYAARVRYRDDQGQCSDWGPWRFFRTNDVSAYLFDPDVIRTFRFTIPQPSWDGMDAEWCCCPPLGPFCSSCDRTYYTATLEVDGQVFDGIGLHLKGGCGTSRTMDQKASFKVNLDWDDPDIAGCPTPRRYLGQTHFTLHNEVQDFTQSHERMGYRLFRAIGVPAPRAVAAQVEVNGESWGPYVSIETIDRRFLKRWMPTNDGMMYEGAYGCELIPGNVPDTLDGDSCFSREFDSSDPCDMPDPGADPTDWELLRTLTEDLEALPDGGFYPQVEAFFEYDNFLSFWSAEGATSHWDGYASNGQNNYRVYHEPTTDRWTMIPWGIDQTFGNVDHDPWDSTALLVNRCKGEPDCEAPFATRLHAVADLFEALDLRAQSLAIRAQIEDLIAADPRKEYNMTQYDTANQNTLSFIDARPDRLRDILANHGY